MATDHFEYPYELYCVDCDEIVDVLIEERTERLVENGHDIDAPYKAAICPKCGCVLCERDRDYTIIRAIKKERRL